MLQEPLVWLLANSHLLLS